MEDPKFTPVISLMRRALRYIGCDIFDEKWRPNVWFALVLAALNMFPWFTVEFFRSNVQRMSYEELTDSISILIGGVGGFVELLDIIVNRHAWRAVMEDIGKRRMKYKSPKVKVLFDQYFERNLLFVRILFMMFIAPPMSILLLPLVYRNPTKFNLALFCTIPWLKPTDPYFFAVNYVYQCYVITATSIVLYVGCIAKVTCIISACCQINALKLLLQDLNEQINDETATPEATRESLGDIIQLYALTKDYVAMIQRKLAILYLVMYAICGGIVCMCLNVIADDIFTSATPLLLTGAFSVMVHCFFGNQLLIDNDGLPEAVYAVDWYKLPLADQKAFRFLLANVQPDVMVHGVLMPLNMGTFVAIMKAAFSYYSILSKKNAK